MNTRSTLNSTTKRAKGFLAEFRDFAMKGNVIDLAVAVVIGGAFGKIVTAFVTDIITPVIGCMTSGVDLAALTWTWGGVAIKWGHLLQSCIDFVIIAFSIFVAIKIMTAIKNKMTKEEEKTEEPAKKPDDVALLEEIRDLLKSRNA